MRVANSRSFSDVISSYNLIFGSISKLLPVMDNRAVTSSIVVIDNFTFENFAVQSGRVTLICHSADVLSRISKAFAVVGASVTRD
jgi:hypothetical protein